MFVIVFVFCMCLCDAHLYISKIEKEKHLHNRTRGNIENCYFFVIFPLFFCEQNICTISASNQISCCSKINEESWRFSWLSSALNPKKNVPVAIADSEWAVDLSLSSRWLFPFERLCVASLLRPFSDRGCRCDLLLGWLWRFAWLPPPLEFAFDWPRSRLRRLFRSFRLCDTTGVNEASSSASITLSSLFESLVVLGALLSAFDSCAIVSYWVYLLGDKKK